MDKVIGLKELRENTESFIKAIKERGSSFLVFRKSKPIFKIAPISDEDGAWETVVDFTKMRKGGVPLAEVMAKMRSWTSSKKHSKT